MNVYYVTCLVMGHDWYTSRNGRWEICAACDRRRKA